ncbi:MAG TPA: argininosuccinate lyase [Thermomicrobiales bacterium]|nr:argininosuccinate lyase [Thermomicrobiales bacterium]
MTAGRAGGSEGAWGWGSRFAAGPDERLQAFNASIGFDQRFVREDIRASVAHARGLARQGIISPDDLSALEGALWAVWDDAAAGPLPFTLADEDIHTGVERLMRELIGDVTGKLHTARSRNDQVATDFRLWARGAGYDVLAGVLDLADTLLSIAADHAGTVMPGYTHLQRAQPIVLGHHLHAYVEMFQRDAERLEQAIARLNRSPLGAAALAGSTFRLDREGVAAELGFDGPTTNSMDGVSDRDFVMDLLMACAMIQVHVSRLSEEVVLWTSAEFRFATLDDRFATGSSIMPQKKNADIAELARGKTGRVIGNLVGMLVTTKGLPLTYNKDLQEDKEGLFDTIDTLRIVLDVVPPMLRTMRWDTERMAAAAVADFALATDAADLLARHGIPFREAHSVVGRLVAECAATGRTFADLTEAEWAAVHPVFGQERPPLDALTSVSARDITGGTAPAQVRKAQDLHTGRLAAMRKRLEERRVIHDRVMSRPATSSDTTGGNHA